MAAMVWGGITRESRSPLVIMVRDINTKRNGFSGISYAQALEEGLLPIWPEEGGVFQQDNAPIHRSHHVKAWLASHNITTVKWPPYSPDINPIENVWHIMKVALHEKYPDLYKLYLSEANVAYLGRCLKEVWEEVLQEKITVMIDSLDHRIRAVIAAKGWYTKY
jgi:transposase